MERIGCGRAIWNSGVSILATHPDRVQWVRSLIARYLGASTGLGGVADPGADLRVLRVVPSGDASLTTAVTVTFDRPVAGSLDRTVDPGAVFAIAPAVAGAVDWRDPVTLRFRPAAPLTPNTSYTVTVANSFAAMDGSRLREPYAFTFCVRGPRVLAGSPIGPNGGTPYLAPDARFDLVVDAPVDPAAVEAGAYVEFNRLCSRPGVVRLAVEGQRALRPTTGGTSARPVAGTATGRPTRSAGWSGLPPGRRCRTDAPATWSCPPPSTSAVGPSHSAGASPPTGTSDWHGRDAVGRATSCSPSGRRKRA
jgi:Bacterial Ig-like domain